MSIFGRLFKIGQSQAHAVLDNLEDPVKMTEQGIRDLKNDLQASMTSLAEIKAVALRAKRIFEEKKTLVQDYGEKAKQLLMRIQSGKLGKEEGERLASQVLSQKKNVADSLPQLEVEWKRQDEQASRIEQKVQQLQSIITRHENDLVTLRARAKTATATEKINRQLAGVDSSSTVAMLERMKRSVEEKELRAEAYANLTGPTLESQVDNALLESSVPVVDQGEDELAKLKQQLGIEG